MPIIKRKIDNLEVFVLTKCQADITPFWEVNGRRCGTHRIFDWVELWVNGICVRSVDDKGNIMCNRGHSKINGQFIRTGLNGRYTGIHYEYNIPR